MQSKKPIELKPLFSFLKRNKFKPESLAGPRLPPSAYPHVFVKDFLCGKARFIFQKYKNGKFSRCLAVYKTNCFSSSIVLSFPVYYTFDKTTKTPDKKYMVDAIKFFQNMDDRFDTYRQEFSSLAESVTKEVRKPKQL